MQKRACEKQPLHSGEAKPWPELRDSTLWSLFARNKTVLCTDGPQIPWWIFITLIFSILKKAFSVLQYSLKSLQVALNKHQSTLVSLLSSLPKMYFVWTSVFEPLNLSQASKSIFMNLKNTWFSDVPGSCIYLLLIERMQLFSTFEYWTSFI